MKISAADKAFADCVKEAYDHVCQVCSRQGRVELSHIYSRRHRTIRWCADNALPKCHACHRWWHENPTESGHWFRRLVGDGAIQLLQEKRDSRIKVPKAEEKEIAAHYRRELEIIKRKRMDGQTGYIEFVSWQ